MSEIIEKYDPEKVELIRMKLENSAKSGTPEYFEILVDDMPIVKRTNDLSLFDSVRAYISKGVRKISFRLFGTAPKGWRHILRSFVMEDTNNSTLSGLDIKAQIDAAIAGERERWQTELLKKELEETKEQLKEAEEYIEQLEDKIEEVRNSKTKTGAVWGEIGSFALEGVLKRNAHKLSKYPIAAELAGLLADEDQTPETKKEPDVEVTYERVSPDSNLSGEDEQYVQILRQIEEKLDENQLTYVMGILGKMLEEPDNIMPVAELLNLNN